MNLYIGRIKIHPPLILAPMAGITDLAFRLTVKGKGGCGLVYSEMISANALIRDHKTTRFMLDSHPEERPFAIQIFGSDPEVMAEAGRIVEETEADILDINLGCPVKKVVKTGAGSALMCSPSRVGKLIKAVRDKVHIPLTAKIRAGWDVASINAVEVARVLEDNGVDAVIIHPRTRSQGFTGRADWDLIARVKKALSIPVIGSGDVTTPAEACEMEEQTECDGIMIGRAARGNPWIFRHIEHFLEKCRKNGPDGVQNGIEENNPGPEELQQTILSHLQLLVERIGQERATNLFKKHLVWYTRGHAGCSCFRKELFSHNSYEDLLASIEDFFQF